MWLRLFCLLLKEPINELGQSEWGIRRLSQGEITQQPMRMDSISVGVLKYRMCGGGMVL